MASLPVCPLPRKFETLSGMIVDANAAAIKFYGYSREKLRKRNIEELNQMQLKVVAVERRIRQRLSSKTGKLN